MQLYGDDQHDVKGMDEVELQHLGHQLVDYVTTYRRMIRIVSPDVEHKLNVLYDIGIKIVNQQYHLLFNDPTIVITNRGNVTLAEYQRALGESMH